MGLMWSITRHSATQISCLGSREPVSDIWNNFSINTIIKSFFKIFDRQTFIFLNVLKFTDVSTFSRFRQRQCCLLTGWLAVCTSPGWGNHGPAGTPCSTRCSDPGREQPQRRPWPSADGCWCWGHPIVPVRGLGKLNGDRRHKTNRKLQSQNYLFCLSTENRSWWKKSHQYYLLSCHKILIANFF